MRAMAITPLERAHGIQMRSAVLKGNGPNSGKSGPWQRRKVRSGMCEPDNPRVAPTDQAM
jgi:hypothetical protein